MLGLGRDHRRRRLRAGRRRRAEAREVLQARVVRQVHAVPRGHALDGVDARARRRGPRDADGPRHHGLRAGADHRQLPVRARRRDGDADRLDGGEVPRRVRGAHRGRARAQPVPRRRGRPIRTRCSCREPPMPRPVEETITFSIDGLEVQAPAGAMLVDAAKLGDVEIPYFCYEPKLGEPVGACRMCLVEIEGIPKLQTACSTPVRDGMVVFTQTDRVKEAQEAIVEFLLINHPLDCPVCDKGGECPLQDITLRLGPRPLALHRAQAPLRQAARAVAADRDRPRALHPLLPLRALQPGDRRGLPARAAGAQREHVRLDVRRPSVRRAVQRQHHRAVPGRRADVAALPLPRAAVGHRGLGLGLHAVPGAVQRRVHRPRRARPARARARPRRRRRRLAVRQGPLRLPVGARRLRASRTRSCASTASSCRSAGSARSTRPRPRCAPPAPTAARSPAARRPTRRASCSRTSCAARSAPRTSTRAPAARCRASCTRRCTRRRCRRRSPTSSSPTPCSCSTASPSTTRRCSTCASARACAATA